MIRQAFTRAVTQSQVVPTTGLLDAILYERPDLRGMTVHFASHGNLGYVAFIGDEAFKAPRYASGVAGNDNEYRILQQLNGHGLPVPTVTCLGQQFAFFGMKAMPGRSLTEGECGKFTRTEQERLAEDIVDVAAGMAEILPRQDGRLAAHGDLHWNNVLIDPVTKKLTAVLDFARVAYVPRHLLLEHVNLGSVAFHEKMQAEFGRRQGSPCL